MRKPGEKTRRDMEEGIRLYMAFEDLVGMEGMEFDLSIKYLNRANWNPERAYDEFKRDLVRSGEAKETDFALRPHELNQ